MVEKIVIAGPASQKLASKIGRILGVEVLSCETKKFADGECYLRINIEDESKVKGKDCIIVQTTGASARGDQNRHYMELIMIIRAIKHIGVEKIRAVVPYFGYSRQDKNFRPGECAFACDLLSMIEGAGADEFYTVDIHNNKIFDSVSIPTVNIDPMEVLANELKSRNLDNPVVICPDKGAYERSRNFAKFLGEGVEVCQFEKKRDVVSGEITMEGDMEISGQDVVIADDIIASGGTMALAFAIAKKNGAKKLYAVGTHPLLLLTAYVRLTNAGVEEIVGTDTLDSSVMTVSMAEIICKALK